MSSAVSPRPVQRLRALYSVLTASMLIAAAPQVLADDDIEGRIRHIDYHQRSFVVKDVKIHTDRRTRYDDGLRHFGDLRVGQKVEVDYRIRHGRRMAREIERDD